MILDGSERCQVNKQCCTRPKGTRGAGGDIEGRSAPAVPHAHAAVTRPRSQQAGGSPSLLTRVAAAGRCVTGRLGGRGPPADASAPYASWHAIGCVQGGLCGEDSPGQALHVPPAAAGKLPDGALGGDVVQQHTAISDAQCHLQRKQGLARVLEFHTKIYRTRPFIGGAQKETDSVVLLVMFSHAVITMI